MILYLRKPHERECIKALSKDAVARFSEEFLELSSAHSLDAMTQRLKQSQILDLACIDVAKAEDIHMLKELRSRHLRAEILLVADSGISPMEYLTPDIRASSLLLRPYGEKQCRQVVLDFFRSFFSLREEGGKKAFVMENQDGKTVIPFQEIYYVEVRERKVFVRLRNKEYSKYDTLEHVLQRLPEAFLQCHRSFAFNTEHFDSVKLSENTIYLEHGISVPLSRSYKPKIKEFVNGLHRV